MEIKSMKQRRTKGFSIVELMVAILIGLIILAGVIQVVVTSKTTFLGQEEMSFIQENARYAMDVIGKDIQGAGYKGCAGQDARIALVAGGDASALEFLAAGDVRGYLNEGDAPDAYSGNLRDVSGGGKSESLLIRSFTGPSRVVKSHSAQTITFVSQHDFLAGDYLGIVAEDCRRAGVFRIATPVTPGTNSTVVTYTPGANHDMPTIKPSLDSDIICPGCSTSYIQNYDGGSVAMNFSANAYYIGTSSALPGLPALKRAVLTRSGTVTSEEIALGVEDIHFRYGIRNGNNTRYVLASEVSDTDWPKVFAVEVSLMMRSQTPSLSTAESKTLGSSGRTYNDRHMRQVVTSIYRIRNRI